MDIKTASGSTVGGWDGESASDLMDELQRIFKSLRLSGSQEKIHPADVPHQKQIPGDLQGFKAYPLWGCDKSGSCVVGAKADRIESAEKIRSYSLDNDDGER